MNFTDSYKTILLFHGVICLFFLSISDAQESDPSIDFVNCNVTISKSGIVAVVCNSSPQQGGHIFLALLDTANKFIFHPCIVNGSLTGYGQNADLGIDEYGNVTVTWEQWQDGRGAVWYTRFSNIGSCIDSAQRTADHDMPSMCPRVSIHPHGNGVIVWQDYRWGRPAIYAQRYGDKGEKIGENFLVTKGISLPQYPCVKMGIDSSMVFAWQDLEEKLFHVYAKESNWKLLFSQNIVVDESKGNAYSSNPEVLNRGADDYFIVWKDYRTGESDIYLQKIKNKKKFTRANIKVNDDRTKQWQRLPRIAGSTKGRFVCVWEDYRNDFKNQIGDIYAQLFNYEGRPIGRNFIVNKTPEPTVQEFPAVAMNEKGKFVVAWCDGRNNQIQVYIQRFLSNGQRIHPERIVFPSPCVD
ncbi:MAG: hypothetical protein PHP42_01245 [Bacteroidota bacterium]|nr:hypothetical protein [Bacteroidota bacterium]